MPIEVSGLLATNHMAPISGASGQIWTTRELSHTLTDTCSGPEVLRPKMGGICPLVGHPADEVSVIGNTTGHRGHKTKPTKECLS